MRGHTTPAGKHFRQFLVAVALLHALAIAGYYLLGIPEAAEHVQRWYAWGWMALTVAVVVVGLRRIKRARGSRAVIRRPD